MCSRSAFFDAALSQNWKESREKRIRLPTDNADAVHTYLSCLYDKAHFKFTVRTLDRHYEGNKPVRSWAGDEVMRLLHLYVLADKLQDVDFADSMLDALIMFCDKVGMWPVEEALFGYEHTTEESPLRKLLCDIIVCEGDDNWIEGLSKVTETEQSRSPTTGEADSSVSPTARWELWRDVAQGFLREKGKGCLGRLPWHADAPYACTNFQKVTKSCQYHLHTRMGTECYKLKNFGAFAGASEADK